MPVHTDQRFTARRPCPICGGHNLSPRGKGVRCYGFRSTDGKTAHCTKAEKAGDLTFNASSRTYPHRLVGSCRCGVRHDPPLVIKRGRSIVDVVTNDNGQPVIRDLSKLAFKGKLDRVAVFLKMVDGHTTPARPPGDVVADMMGAKIIPLPLLRGIIQAPIYSRQGALSTEEGYQPETEFYFRPEKRLLFSSVPQDPKPANHVRPHSQIRTAAATAGLVRGGGPSLRLGRHPEGAVEVNLVYRPYRSTGSAGATHRRRRGTDGLGHPGTTDKTSDENPDPQSR